MKKSWLPPDILARNTLVQGGAFKAEYQFSESDEIKIRFLFILNKNPSEDAEILFVTTTTQIEKTLKFRKTHELVFLQPQQYEPLKQNCVIDCRSIQQKNKNWLLEKIKEQKIEPLRELPTEILEKIKISILKNETIPEKTKQQIFGEDEE